MEQRIYPCTQRSNALLLEARGGGIAVVCCFFSAFFDKNERPSSAYKEGAKSFIAQRSSWLSSLSKFAAKKALKIKIQTEKSSVFF